MLDFLRDYAYEMSELSQAFTVFFAMVIAIALAVPIPIAVSIGTVIGYFMLDLILLELQTLCIQALSLSH